MKNMLQVIQTIWYTKPSIILEEIILISIFQAFSMQFRSGDALFGHFLNDWTVYRFRLKIWFQFQR